MPTFPKEIEVQRIMNLVQGFGWEKEKEEVVGDTLKLTLWKKIQVKAPEESGMAPA